MNSFITSQVLIAIARLLYLASFQFKERKHVLTCIIAAAYFIGAHFFFLDRATAGLLPCLTGTRVMTALFYAIPPGYVFFPRFSQHRLWRAASNP